MDTQGILCAGVSSGGLSLKLPGRVGHVSRSFTATSYNVFINRQQFLDVVVGPRITLKVQGIYQGLHVAYQVHTSIA